MEKARICLGVQPKGEWRVVEQVRQAIGDQVGWSLRTLVFLERNGKPLQNFEQRSNFVYLYSKSLLAESIDSVTLSDMNKTNFSLC